MDNFKAQLAGFGMMAVIALLLNLALLGAGVYVVVSVLRATGVIH